MLLGLALFLQLAGTCAPQVAPETLASIARTESSFDAYTLHDNDTGDVFHSSSKSEVATRAQTLIDSGHSVDVGLMQINSKNFHRLGLTVATALDPCRSLKASAQILLDDYHPGLSDADDQRNLRDTISRYNTGNPVKGYLNGYVNSVESSAKQIIPAIHVLLELFPINPGHIQRVQRS